MPLDFDGVDDYVDCGDINAIDGTAALTVSLWLTADANQFTVFASKSDAAGTAGWLFQTENADNTKVIFYSGSGLSYGTTPTATLVAGAMTHLVAVFDGAGAANADRLKIYVNRVNQTLAFTGTIPATLSATATSVRFGTWQALTLLLNGKMDDARIYNRALAASEVDDLYAARGADSIYNGIIGRWRMDEGASGAGSVIDLTANNNNGTPVGGPTYQESSLRKCRRVA
jgi:hypothetical protein